MLPKCIYPFHEKIIELDCFVHWVSLERPGATVAVRSHRRDATKAETLALDYGDTARGGAAFGLFILFILTINCPNTHSQLRVLDAHTAAATMLPFCLHMLKLSHHPRLAQCG